VAIGRRSFEEFYAGTVDRLLGQLFLVTTDLHEAEEVVQEDTRDEWLDQLPTQSDHSQLPPAKLQEVLEGIGAAVDALGGSFTMRYTTLVVTAARASAAT